MAIRRSTRTCRRESGAAWCSSIRLSTAPGSFQRLTQGLAGAHKKFATGVYALWYPLMEPVAMRAFERGIVATRIPKVLQLEISVRPASWTSSMRGCGLVVVNPPFGFDTAARAILAWLWPVLSRDGEGGHQVKWLAGERVQAGA
jgi:23S rRNA (adenine2030-N6)-methyltransferase